MRKFLQKYIKIGKKRYKLCKPYTDTVTLAKYTVNIHTVNIYTVNIYTVNFTL